jgi:hypothetical protein
MITMTMLLSISGCRRAEHAVVVPAKPAAIEDVDRLKAEAIGVPFAGKPWITHLIAVDLDRDGRMDIIACDAKENTIVWLRQVAPEKFVESTLASGILGPAHVAAVDIDGDGDIDLLVASMGEIFPNNDKIGTIVVLENKGHQQFSKHVIAEHVARVTDVEAGDFNGDGRLDLAVAQFGYDQGETCWMENLGSWLFKRHVLQSLSGPINVCVGDFNGDGKSDIVSLLSQEWEEVHLFENDGRGNFVDKVIFGSTNEDYGSSGISVCDLNRDGRPDILYTNGDGFDYAEPGARPWHGVQWLENRGEGLFKYHRIGDLPGAYSPIGVDFDRDGAIDVLAVSGFNDWKNPRSVSMMLFHNDGRMNFTPHVLAHTPTHLVTCAAADFDGTGRPVLITGGFHAYPPFDRMSRITLWRQQDRP